MTNCLTCNGKGFITGSTSPDCPACDGRGQIETEEDIRYACLQRAICSTGYREGGGEEADIRNHRGYPYSVTQEYQRQCRRKGVSA